MKPDERIYPKGWGWDLFSTDNGVQIMRMDENCWPESNPNFMDDETAEWLVMFLAYGEDDQDAWMALETATFSYGAGENDE